MSIPNIRDFDFLKPISKGAYGKVFLGCKKNSPDQLFAIKILSKDEMKKKNLTCQITAERDALAVSKSPFIVHLYYSLQSNSKVFLVMEYLNGGDLKSLLQVVGYFDEGDALLYCAEIILALEYLHSHSIIHRDIKPDNILISASGHLKLTDFGLSTVSWSQKPSVNDVLTTPSCKPVLYTRTPGQLLSLMSNFEMDENTPTVKKNLSAEMIGSEVKSDDEEIAVTDDDRSLILEELKRQANQDKENVFGNKEKKGNRKIIVTPHRKASVTLREVFYNDASLDQIFANDSVADRTALENLIKEVPLENWQLMKMLKRRSLVQTNKLNLSWDMEELENSSFDLGNSSICVETDCKAKTVSSSSPATETSFEAPKAPASNPRGETSRVRFAKSDICDLSESMSRVTLNTPCRTPKSVKRVRTDDDLRPAPLLGTPDYLAPELLFNDRPHGPQVDWWAFGVCVFELVTGLPPFNDATPDLVFTHITRREIPWPKGDEALSQESFDVIDALLTMEPTLRPSADRLKTFAWFAKIPWETMSEQSMPFVPQPEDATDTFYFNARNVLQGVQLTFSDSEID